MNSLTAHAIKINEQHNLANACAQKAVAHAQEAGKLLLEAKEKLGHGEWLPWLQTNCQFSARAAQGYMRLAKEIPKLDELNTQRVAHMPLRQALAALSQHDDGPDQRMIAARQNGQRFSNSHQYFTNFRNKLVAVSPSAQHPDHFFVEVVDTEVWIAEGFFRPLHKMAISIALDALGVPEDILFSKHPSEGLENTIWMKNDCAQEKYAAAIKMGLVAE